MYFSRRASGRTPRARRAGTYFEIAFDEAQLGFAARLARVHGPERKRPRAWCAVTVESVDDEFPVAAEHLCRGDEVVAVDGEPIAIRDDPQYDSRCRKAAFAALKSRIAKAPRPVTLGFVRGVAERAAGALRAFDVAYEAELRQYEAEGVGG